METMEARAHVPSLEELRGHKMTPWALGAKNLRRELQTKWPHVQWSVKSRSYSGGCSIDIRWDFGPTSKQVDEIGDQYERCGFDGMQDMKTYHKNAHAEQFGGADYVMGSRRWGADEMGFLERVGRDICALQRVEYRDLNMRCVCGENDGQTLQDHIWRLLSATSFGLGEQYAGVEYMPRDEQTGIEWLRVIKTKL